MAGTKVAKGIKEIDMHSGLSHIKFTPIQQLMLEILSDGESHSNEELLAVCGPAGKATVRAHMFLLRKKLEGTEHEIVTVYIYPNKVAYKHVRRLNGASGKR